ncbi:3-oxoacyl-ACP reductase [Dermacoccus nishinomiyaensis]|uniref:3-oxoacyl-ACP reductase n=1 Tax=Dermacoccus nishinomiyaensis TaxID=1274 RepID=UPI001EF54387|nr:3-oxoacyl-ACP reductase [Dermacoccus nishinomiyaensis]MCG7430064.1 3-oxoacyl-ACP reductase [Dermacoccus nishinomiyaensis]
MADGYSNFVNNGFGKKLAKQIGLPQPPVLRRYEVGQDLLDGPAAVGTVGSGVVGSTAAAILRGSGADVVDATAEATYSDKLGAFVIDVTAATKLSDLETFREIAIPAVKALGRSARVIVMATTPSALDDVEAAATAQAFEGITRSIGKELRAGGSANLFWIDPDAQGDAAVLEAPLRFFGSSRSAYVSGQPIRIRKHAVTEVADWHQPFAGQVAVITGAARGIGAQIARVFARAGAHVIAVDIPAAGDALSKVANEIGGTSLGLDITSPDAGAKIAEAVARHADKLDVIVHNAGITRDKLFVNTDEARWNSVVDVNLGAQFRINEVLLDPATKGGLKDGGRIVSVASTSGIGGNRGQANYAASKAGVIGMVRELSEKLAERDITVNAVAPGFIETDMTSKIPMATREVGRRLNSMMQGGNPIDVGEAIAFFAEPGSAGVTGQVLRVCGQSQIGA